MQGGQRTRAARSARNLDHLVDKDSTFVLRTNLGPEASTTILSAIWVADEQRLVCE